MVGQQRQELNVKDFTTAVVNRYEEIRDTLGKDHARQETMRGAATAEAVYKISGEKAANMAKEAMTAYDSARDHGASHKHSRDEAVKQIDGKFDSRGNEKTVERTQERSRDGVNMGGFAGASL